MYPVFSPDTLHYAVRCEHQETLTVTATKLSSAATLALNGRPVPEISEEMVDVTSDSDLVIEVRNDDQIATYVVHCVPSDFPEVTILRKEPGVSEGLLLVAPRYTNSQYIAILDNNGVPRFHRRIGQRASDFKWHSRHRVYSYVEGIGRNSYDQNDYVIVILDQQFDEIHRARTVNLNHTDNHDFLITDEGNYLLLSYNSVRRDLSAYPDDDGTFTYSTAELSRDSVIQEVSPQGELLAEWNSWNHMKISDCLQHRYPDDYAHINSLHIVDGDIVASFRGCSQVLKIAWPSGDVIWQLGGTDPRDPDLYDSNRPLFDRRFFEIVGDPESDGFCGQHSAIETEHGTIVLFDNGIYCVGERTDASDRDVRGRSRVVEYELSGDTGTFLRHHQPQEQARSVSAGGVRVLDNGNWLMTWGRGPQVSITEVNPEGREVFAVKITNPDDGNEIAGTYRVYRESALTLPLNLP